MRTFFHSRQLNRLAASRRHSSRRDFLRLEHLENRYALAGASPGAVNDLYHAVVDQPLEVAAPAGILANDTDAEGDELAAGLFSGPSNGSLTLNEDGSFHYQPNAGFLGLDSFIYFASDGAGDSLLAAVTIRVEAPNSPPVAANDSYATDEDSPLSIGVADGILANDSDADGGTLTPTVTSQPQHGTLSVNADGSFTYTPEANYNGLDGFSYFVNDGSLDSDVASVTINVAAVNDAPDSANDEYTTAEDTPLEVVAPGVLANDTDADGDALSAILVAPPQHGTVTLNADGSLLYTPDPDFNGVDGFSYQAGDGSADSDVASVTITVTPAADAPVGADDSYSVDEDAVLSVDAASGVLINDSDADGDALTAALVAGPAHGTLTLNADGSFSYAPTANFSGSDSFTYTASDGSLVSAAMTVTITVNPTNDAPAAGNDEYTTAEDTPLTIAAPGVLGNDTDPESDPLTVTIMSPPTHGTVTLNSDGSFTYTPNADFTGVDGFSYLASDGTASSEAAGVTINVTPVNDAPLAEGESYVTDEEAALVVDAAGGVLANDSDPDGDPLSAAIVTGPTSGALVLNADGSFTYTPNAGFSGSDSFTYSVSDGTLTTEATATITVNSTNDAPVASDDELHVDEDETLTVDAPGIMANDSDPDSDPLTASLVAGPTNGTLTLNPDGSLSYTPNANFNGSDSFTYTVADDELVSNTATVTIVVCGVNDGPTAADDAWSVDEDQVLTVAAPGVLANDTDGDGESLSAAIVTGPTNGTVTMSADGSFVYTPNSNFSGTDTFVYAAGDGSATGEATVTITVNPVVDVAPVAAIDNYSTGEDVPFTVGAGLGVLANDLDPSGLGLTASVVDNPAHGTLVLSADGGFSYTPGANWNGTDSFTYKAVNSSGEEIVSQANIVVEPLNDWPVAVDDEVTIANENVVNDEVGELAESAVTTSIMANDTDIDGNTLTATLVQGPAHGTLVLNSDGTFNYVPEEGFTGDDSFRYQLFDGMANSNVATVTLHVEAAPNAAPTSVADSYATQEDLALTIDAAAGVLANDSDPDGDVLTAAVVTGPANGTVTMSADGSFVYTPATGFSGQDTFTYQASDGTLTGAETTVTIDISASAALPPTAVDDVFTMTADEVLEIASPGVLANDTDAEGDPLSAEVVTGPEHGTVALDTSGGFVYTPTAGYTGSDTFTYQATDGAGVSNVATVSITIEAAANQRPEAINDSFTMDEGTTLETTADLGLLLNDIDPEAAPLVASLFSGPLNGSLTLNDDGSFTYTPNDGFTGIDSFLYRVSDGELLSALGAVTIHVNPLEDPEPAPIPEPDPNPGHCLAMDGLLDQILAEGDGGAAADAALGDEAWLA